MATELYELIVGYDNVASESDSEDESEQLIVDDDDVLPNSGIEAFSFESTCSEKELKERLARISELKETHLGSRTTSNSDDVSSYLRIVCI